MTFSVKKEDFLDIVCYEAMKNNASTQEIVETIENIVVASRTEDQKNDMRISPTYESFKITTVESFCNVPPKIWPNLKAELGDLVESIMMSIATMIALNNNIDYLKFRHMIQQYETTWIDDAQTNQTSNLTAVTKDEVVEFSKTRKNNKDNFVPTVTMHKKH